MLQTFCFKRRSQEYIQEERTEERKWRKRGRGRGSRQGKQLRNLLSYQFILHVILFTIYSDGITRTKSRRNGKKKVIQKNKEKRAGKKTQKDKRIYLNIYRERQRERILLYVWQRYKRIGEFDDVDSFSFFFCFFFFVDSPSLIYSFKTQYPRGAKNKGKNQHRQRLAGGGEGRIGGKRKFRRNLNLARTKKKIND